MTTIKVLVPFEIKAENPDEILNDFYSRIRDRFNIPAVVNGTNYSWRQLSITEEEFFKTVVRL